MRLLGSETVTVTGAVQAPALMLTAGLLDNSGELSSSGLSGGQLAIGAEKFVNSGRITSDGSAGAGGNISITLAQRMMQTQSGLISASGVGGSGGQVTMIAGEGISSADADTTCVTGVFLSGPGCRGRIWCGISGRPNHGDGRAIGFVRRTVAGRRRCRRRTDSRGWRFSWDKRGTVPIFV